MSYSPQETFAELERVRAEIRRLEQYIADLQAEAVCPQCGSRDRDVMRIQGCDIGQAHSWHREVGA